MHQFDGDGLDQLLRLALAEDLGVGDVTSESLIPADAVGAAVVVAKSELVLAGLDAAERTFAMLDPKVKFVRKAQDGDLLGPGSLAAEVSGPLRTLLIGERTALNFLQRLSGVATHTKRCVDALAGTNTRLLDTRKTTPGFRALEKRAVKAGGGFGHRTSLADGVLIKDNHVAAVGGITEAIKRARASVHPLLKVEVEVKSEAELREALDAGADMVLLDNMTDAQLAACVKIVNGRIPTEASGNMTIERLKSVAAAGVSFVSMGALTHSSPAADLSFALTRRS